MTSIVFFAHTIRRTSATVMAATSLGLAALLMIATATDAQARKAARAKPCATADHANCGKSRKEISPSSATITHRITQHIARYVEYPRESQYRREMGRSYTSFMVSPTGEVSDIKTELSSGFSQLDRAARQAVMLASPLPADLIGLLKRRCKFIVPIGFRMM